MQLEQDYYFVIYVANKFMTVVLGMEKGIFAVHASFLANTNNLNIQKTVKVQIPFLLIKPSKFKTDRQSSNI